MNITDLEINIDGYSGPFDLLCSLVENKKFQVSGIKISQLIKIYGLYLVKTSQTPADTLAEFFYMTAGLLLEKTRSLLPGSKPDDDSVPIPNEQQFLKSLERYRPYRKAYLELAEKFASQSKFFRRKIPELTENPEREIIISSSSVYILAKTWKSIHEKYSQNLRTKRDLAESQAKADWDGFAENDQKQIDSRIIELQELMKFSRSLSFNGLCSSGGNLVVTLLAVLELCRMGKAYIEQDELFADVRIITKD